MTAVRRLSLVDTETGTSSPTRPQGAVRVAIASRDMKNLNAHFGSASKFAVYDVTKEGWHFVEALSFDDASDESGAHKTDGDDRITPKIAALTGCHLLFCLAIGGPSAAKVVAAKIHPIKVPSPSPIEEVLERTRVMLNGTPPPWLRKVLAEAGVGPAKADFEED
ncbi:MAG: nitrogen fixation protein NifX [Ancalomicrobiaceae bacterium]|nr:nitrogen fixation protein NifX [Ancalomicrobiaceae bacterium]